MLMCDKVHDLMAYQATSVQFVSLKEVGSLS